MAKALKIAATVVGVAALAVVTGGAALGFGVSLATTAFGVSAGALLAVSAGLQLASAALTKSPAVPTSQTQRLVASVDPRAFRKTVLGQTAMATDIRYEEWSGANQEYCDWIICLASHAIDGVEEIWIDQEMAWSATTGVTGKFAGYFSVPNIILEGSPSNAFTFGSGQWNGSTRLTGCAYLRLRFKTTGNGKKATSPFSSGISTRLTIIGRGAKLYDPRRDSTVPGGSGPMRWNDQSTWRYTADDGAVIGENLALQILRVVLGWRIRNPVTGEWRLATGSGVPGRRIGMASFQTAANLCDELVNRSAGGQEPRYHGAGVVSEGDDPGTVLDALCAACCGRFRDTGGKLELAIAHNDLAAAAADDGLNDDDVVGPFTWDPDPSLETTPNVIRGRYVDATAASLYQLIDFPEVRIASPDGQDRIAPLDLGFVESPSQAQRVASQVLQRKQYQRSFSAPFDIRAWKYGVGDVVPFTFAPLGFSRALFRVADQEQGQGGTCQMTLTVEHQALYAWDANDAAPVLAADPIVYDRGNNPLILAIDEASETALWSGVIDDDGNRPEDGATVGAPGDTPVGDLTGKLVADAMKAMSEGVDVSDVVEGARDLAAEARQSAAAMRELTGAPKGDVTGAVNGAREVVSNARASAISALANQLLGEERKARFDRLSHMDGLPMGTVVRQEVRERKEGQAEIVETIDLIGKRTEDGLAFVLDQVTLKVSPTQSLAEKFVAVAAEITGPDGPIQAVATELTQAIADEQGARAQAVTDLRTEITGPDGPIQAVATNLTQAISDQDSARAQAITDLRTEITGPDGPIQAIATDLTQAISDQDSARAQAITDLRTEITGPTGPIQAVATDLTQAISDQDSARAQAITDLRTELAGPDGTRLALATDLTQAISDQDSARAQAITDLRTELAGPDGTRLALATDLTQAISDQDSARAQAITDLRTEITGPTGPISAVNTRLDEALSGEEGSLARTVLDLATEVDGQKSSVELLLETVNGETANAQLVTNVNGQITGFRINGQDSLFFVAADRFVVGSDQAFEVVNGVTRIKRLVIGNGNVGFDELLLQSLIKRGLDSSAGGTQPTLGGGNQFADFAIPLGTINPAGTFTLKFLGAPALPMHQDYTTTLNGKPAYFRYVNDGGFSIRCVDAQGNVYSFGGDRYLDDQSVKATTPFDATFVATITRGNTDTGWVDDGDYYYRYVSQQYSIGAFEAELTWRAL